MADKVSSIGNLEQYVQKILQPDKEEINGTGFFCHPGGYILTCYHVIEPHLKAGKTEVNVRARTIRRKFAENTALKMRR